MEKTLKGRLKHLVSGMTFRIICGTILLLLIFETVVSAIGYAQFAKSLTKEYSDSAFRTAETAAAIVNGDKVDTYLKVGMDSYEYRDVLERMNTLCQKQNVTMIYVIKVDTSDYGRFQSVIDVVNNNSEYTPWEVGYQRDTTNEEYRDLYRQIYEGHLQRGEILRTTNLNGGQPHLTSMVPINGFDGSVKAILCVQRPMNELVSVRRSYGRNVVLIALVLGVLSTFGTVTFLRREFVMPIDKVKNEAARFAQENTYTEHDSLTKVSRIRELNELGGSIEKMERDTLEYVENITKMTAENERIGTELSLANEIQSNMLPNIFPAFPERHDVDIYASMTPAKEVGGDFYDFFLIDEDHLGLVMADVSGKGVPAALFMMMSKILFSNLALMGGSPAEVLKRANDSICKNNKSDMFVTAWFGILTLSTGQLVAANAGHEYPVIKKAGGKYELFKDPHRLAVGAFSATRYVEYEMELEKGDVLFLYTDGIPEATNRAREMLGTDRMLELLNKNEDTELKTLLEGLKTDVGAFVGDAPQFDDLTMMAVRRL